MKKRLFLAIPLSASLLQKLSAVKDRYGLDGEVRWTTKQNLHITVCFFGDIEEKDIPVMGEKIKGIVAGTPGFSLYFERILFAPPFRTPNMIWADFKPGKEYAELVKKIYAAAKEFMPPENIRESYRDPMPHITLARFHNPAVTYQLKLETLESEEMRAETCELIESELTPKGSVYTVIEKYALA
jgi:RNA 2',3'-cyclic 3'-phosphodiesterase